MKLRTLTARLFAVCLLAVPVLAMPRASFADDAPATGKWEKVTSKAGINVFKKEIEGSPVIAFKGDGVIDAPILRVASVLVDASRNKEWMDRVVESEIVEVKSPTERVQYSHIKTPTPLDDRDFVSQAKLVVDGANKRLTFSIQSVTHASKPERKGIVRGQLMGSSFLLVPVGADKTRVITEFHADPKGDVPKFIVNLFQEDWPINTIKGLRKQVGKVSDNAELKGIIEEKGFVFPLRSLWSALPRRGRQLPRPSGPGRLSVFG